MNANQCDDGNQRPGDGCSDDCKIETGWTCSGGSPIRPDVCAEKCGDGRRFNQDPWYCDDGNTRDGDGCSSRCTVEPAMSCSGGSLTTPDVCTEICGDGFNAGFYACDDGNLRDGDGCSS